LKVLLVGAELFHAGGLADCRTEKTQLTIAIRNFAKTPKEHSKETKLSENKIVQKLAFTVPSEGPSAELRKETFNTASSKEEVYVLNILMK
jgi:hypothetical protein